MLKKINNTSCFFHHVAAIVGKLAGIKLITTVHHVYFAIANQPLFQTCCATHFSPKLLQWHTFQL